MTRRVRRTIFGLFLVSGISGLIYEVVWVRQLSLIFGVSVYAVSAVLTAYMAGMALGSYVFGHWIDRLVDRRQVLLVYAILEMGICLTALLLPVAISGVTGLYVWIARHTTLSLYLLNLIRFALSQPITLAIVGCANPDQVKILAREGRQFHPMSSEEQDRIIDRFRPHAQRLAYYRGVR